MAAGGSNQLVLTDGRASALVLLSGGLDSATVLRLLLAEGLDCDALFADYGQPATRAEERAAAAVADEAGVPLTTVRVAGFEVRPGEIPGRNRLLAALAFTVSASRHANIALGIHAGTDYADCSPAFLNAVQRCFDVEAAGRVRLIAPLLELRKLEVLRLARDLGVPLTTTWSCEVSDDRPCGRCPSCQDRRSLGVDA